MSVPSFKTLKYWFWEDLMEFTVSTDSLVEVVVMTLSPFCSKFSKLLTNSTT